MICIGVLVEYFESVWVHSVWVQYVGTVCVGAVCVGNVCVCSLYGYSNTLMIIGFHF